MASISAGKQHGNRGQRELLERGEYTAYTLYEQTLGHDESEAS
jgi:hypothetical protein